MKASAADSGRNLLQRMLQPARNGMLLYWSSFFILILLEFYIGGRLSVILTKENYATYISVLNTLPFYTILANVGISYSIIYIVSYNRNIGNSVFGQAMQLQRIWYFIIVAIHALLFLLFRNMYLQIILITSIISFTYTQRLNVNSYFLAMQSFNKAAISSLLQKSVLLLAFLFISFSGVAGAFNDHFPFLYLATEFSVVLFYFIVFPKTIASSFTTTKHNYRKRLLKYGKYAMVNNGLNVLYYTIIAFIIRASHMEIHLQIVLGLCIVFFRYTAVSIAPIFSTMNPQLTLIKNDTYKIQEFYKKYLIITALLSLVTLLACRFLFSFFIDHFYAASYHDLPGYFNFFSYLVPLLFLTSLNGSVLASLGKIKFTTWVELVCTAVLLLFFTYNYFVPVTNYRIIFYMVLIHLCIKFLMLNFGAYKTIKLR